MDLGTSFAEFAEQLRSLTPILREELGVEHFVVGGVSATLTCHRPNHVGRRLTVESEALGSPRLGFVYTFGSSAPGEITAPLRLPVDTELDTHEFEAVDDQLVVFPADQHHEIGATCGPADSHRFSITGFVTGATLHDTPMLDDTVRTRPSAASPARITADGYEVRPIPEPVHDLLVAMLDLRRSKNAHGTRNPWDGARRGRQLHRAP